MELKSEVDAIGMNLCKNSNKSILDFEKYQANHNTIKKVINGVQEITDHKKIDNPFFFVLQKTFQRKLQNEIKKLLTFLKDILIPSVTAKQKKFVKMD